MAKTDNLTDFLTDVADALREKTGGGQINPQDFADMIRALPVRGEVDHEWHIFYDDNKPAALYGGTWECLGEGIFLRSEGENTSIAASSKTTTKDGGSADAVVVMHDHRTVIKLQGAGTGENSTAILYPNGWGDADKFYYDFDNIAYSEETGEDGTGQNNPPYKNCHIWRRIS